MQGIAPRALTSPRSSLRASAMAGKHGISGPRSLSATSHQVREIDRDWASSPRTVTCIALDFDPNRSTASAVLCSRGTSGTSELSNPARTSHDAAHVDSMPLVMPTPA